MLKKIVSIIIPIFNEEKNIPLIYRAVVNAEKMLCDKYDFEIIFVDDGSADGSAKALESLAKKTRK